MTKKMLIIHNIAQAQHCVENILHHESLLFSTHSSVDTYLREKYSVACRGLSSLLDYKEMIQLKEESSQLVDNILHKLDLVITPQVNKQTGLSMRYFKPMYAYYGKCHLLSYKCFVKALTKAIQIYSIDDISFYNYRFNCFIDTSTDMKSLMSSFSSLVMTHVIDFKSNVIDYCSEYRFINPFHHIIKDFYSILKRKVSRCIDYLYYMRYSPFRKTILLYQSLYNLEFLEKEYKKYNVVYYRHGATVPVGGRKVNLENKIKITFEEDDFLFKNNSPTDLIFLKDLKEDFLKNIDQLIGVVYSIKDFNKTYPISLGVWGNPPIEKSKALIFEYLHSCGIPIMGAQHGCIYGDSYEPWHFDSDFNNCDYYISFGFDLHDLWRLYPGREIKMQIMPFKMLHSNGDTCKNKKKNIDFLFPITFDMSFFEGGMIRIPPHELTERQIKILEFLNSHENLCNYIKPTKNSNISNLSVIPVLERLKNLNIVSYLILREFLARYQPKAVIIEFPSQPLFDVIHLDVEIFILNNPISPYETKALEELKKRVYYAENIEEMLGWIDLFVKGKLPPKRDNTFYNHYINKDNTKENIIELIDNLTNRAN